MYNVNIELLRKRIDSMKYSYDGLNPSTPMNTLLYLTMSISYYGNSLVSVEMASYFGGIDCLIALLEKVLDKKLMYQKMPVAYDMVSIARECYKIKTIVG